MTLADILAAIQEQLDWTGPTEKKMGHIVITREQAEYLHRTVMAIIMERDQLLFEKENPDTENLHRILQQIHSLAEIKTAGDAGKGSMSERLEKIWKLTK